MDRKTHIDTCYSNSSGIYYLKDVSRRANQTGHSHNGQMAADAAVETHYYGSGLIDDTDNVWEGADHPEGVDAHVYAGWVYDYLLFEHGLNSFDKAGSTWIVD